MSRSLLARVRWTNVALAVLVLGVVALLVAWPRLSAPLPELPPAGDPVEAVATPAAPADVGAVHDEPPAPADGAAAADDAGDGTAAGSGSGLGTTPEAEDRTDGAGPAPARRRRRPTKRPGEEATVRARERPPAPQRPPATATAPPASASPPVPAVPRVPSPPPAREFDGFER